MSQEKYPSGETPVTLLYDLDGRPPLNQTIVYAVQWLIFTLANSAVIPLVVGTALGLDQAGIADLAQRTLFFIALDRKSVV